MTHIGEVGDGRVGGGHRDRVSFLAVGDHSVVPEYPALRGQVGWCEGSPSHSGRRAVFQRGVEFGTEVGQCRDER
ncbi:MAG: hypothetical protein ACRDQ7_20620 [Haloechinothrix sp.]